MTTIKLGDYVRTGLGEVGTVVKFDKGLVVLEDCDHNTFYAVWAYCEVIGEGDDAI